MGKNVGHITVYIQFICVDSESCIGIGNVVSLDFH